MTSVAPNYFAIESIEIKSFRAYNNLQSFIFKQPLAVFYGKNGNGKSSTLFAIEWCHFGRIEFRYRFEGRARG